MKTRLANKVLSNALASGSLPRGSALARAVRTMPCGSRKHPRKYLHAGLCAAFLRKGYSIHQQRFILDSKQAELRIMEIGGH